MNDPSFPFSVEHWSIVTENKEYRTPIFDLLKKTYQNPSEVHEEEFYVLEAPEWVNVIALTPDEAVVLVEQYRFGLDEPTLEIPGGIVDEGEKPLEAAKRELREETGYKTGRWSSLGKVSSNPAIQSNYTHCFLAEECSYEESINPDEQEQIDVHLMPVPEFLDLVKQGVIHHSIVVAAVAKWMLTGNVDV